MKDKFQLITDSKKCRSLRPGEILIKDKKLWVAVNPTEKGYLLKSVPAGEPGIVLSSESVKIVTEVRCELVT